MKWLSTADIGIDELSTAVTVIDEVTADIGIDEVAIYCWYCYRRSNYLLLILLLMKSIQRYILCRWSCGDIDDETYLNSKIGDDFW